MTDVALVVVSAGVGALSGILTTAWKSRKDLEAQYDIDLRERRIEAYELLWKDLELLADYFAAATLTKDDVRTLGSTLRRWYFHTGGLLLSTTTRAAYFNLQAALTGLRDVEEIAEDDPRRKILKALASRLRTATTRDVATRVAPRLGPTVRSKLSRVARRWTRSTRATVDRRWSWAGGEPQSAFFVVVENVGGRALKIDRVLLDGKAGEVVGECTLPVWLEPREECELEVRIPGGVTAVAPRVEVKVAERGDAYRAPHVPLPSDLVRP